MKRTRGRHRKLQHIPRHQSNTLTPRQSASRSKQKRPIKSKYFESDSDLSQSNAKDSGIESEYENGGTSAASKSSSETESLDSNYKDEGYPAKKRRSSVKSVNETPKQRKKRSVTQGNELWRSGVRADVEPGKEVLYDRCFLIKLPKARSAGHIAYRDETIHPNTMMFLADLKQNNDREWLKVHDADFRQAQKDWSSFIEHLTTKLITKDNTLPELPVKDIVFRIYRDIRFTKDPTPYKTHFSAADGRGHMLHIIAPGSSFLGGGLWHPESASLSNLREEIDTRPERIHQVLVDEGIREVFFDGIENDYQKAIEKFTSQNSSNALKRKPKGYDDNHPNIDLLRLKNYTIGRKLTDEDVISTGCLSQITNMLGSLTPFITYLNSIVMPDEINSNDSSSEVESSPV